MEAKSSSDDSRPTSKHTDDKSDSDCEVDTAGAPSPNVVALRHGYNQSYIIRSSKSNIHEVLFRCGNWCYAGKVDLGSPALELADLPMVIPALQKQQGSLQYLCEWRALPSTSPYSVPLETLYDAFDFIGSELASERIEKKLQRAIQDDNSWIEEDSSNKHFFELVSGGYECFDDVDLVASKTFVRGLVLLIIYYQRSFYIVLQEGEGEQPLLDVRFPDLTAHLQGVHLQTYKDDDCTNMKKLMIWQAGERSELAVRSPPKTLKLECKDVSGQGYNQTFVIRRTPRTDGGTGSLREVLFRFGNWCYNGHVDLGPKLELGDVPVIIPLLRRQQSALTFMCEATKMPATSLFTPSMSYLAQAMPALQGELSRAEQIVRELAKNGESGKRASWWLEGEGIDCFFEAGVAPSEQLKDVEAIASKSYLGEVVLVAIYFDSTFYVYIEQNDEEQPLLDTSFPDVSYPKEGVQLQTYAQGVGGCEELRRLSLWRVLDEPFGSDDSDSEEQPATSVLPVSSSKTPAAVSDNLQADAKANEKRSEDADVKRVTGQLDSKLAVGGTNKRFPHHIAPLGSSNTAVTLQKIPDLGVKAPWDSTGRPLGLRSSK